MLSRAHSGQGESRSCVRSDQEFRVERMTGIEPAFSAWEADVLPLNYIRSGPETSGGRMARHLRQRPRIVAQA